MLIGARLLQYAAAMVLFGSPLFFLYGRESNSAASGEPSRWSWQHRLVLIAAAVALLGVVVWVMAETAALSEDARDAIRPAALWTVLSDTHFGRACLVRIALLTLSIVVSLFPPRARILWIVQVILGGAVTASFAWTGHGVMDRGIPGAVHLGGDLGHLLAAGVWIGALVPLGVMATRGPASAEVRAMQFGLDRFSSIGIPVVAVLVFGGLINSWYLIGPAHWRALAETGYGVTLLIKLGLFATMLVLATLNRYRWVPELRDVLQSQRSANDVQRALRATVIIEIGVAMLVLLAISLLGTLVPPISL